MRCLRPIKVYNQARFVSPLASDPLIMYVNCGKCANCQKNKHAEWNFRAFKHYEDLINKGRGSSYMLFDTLTYDDNSLPHLLDFDEFKLLPRMLNHSCFNSNHVRLFMVRLRDRLRKLGYGKNVFDYFLTSEYGHDNLYVDGRGRVRRGTLRPHYHVLFYVRKNVPFYEFSKLVSSCWSYGRTDGVPYRPLQYVQNNVFNQLNSLALKKIGYVSKYVMKSSSFSDLVCKRVSSVLYELVGFDLDKLNSDDMRRLRSKMIRLVDVFHRQSHYFGLSAIEGIDIPSLFDAGFFKMPSSKQNVYTRIPISQYYLRKLCYEPIYLDGINKVWSVKSDMIDLLYKRRDSMRRNRVNGLRADVLNYGLTNLSDLDQLVLYESNYCGRYVGDDFAILSLPEKIASSKFYVYASVADKNHFGMRFVTDRYCGSKDNYLPISGNVVPLVDFVELHSYNENSAPCFSRFDETLDLIRDRIASDSDSYQLQFDHLQSLRDRLQCVFNC